MSLFQRLTIDSFQWFLSGGILVFWIVFWAVKKYYLAPGFVLPGSQINKFKKFFYRLLIGLIIVLTALLPLEVSFITGKKTIKEKTLNVQILFDVSLSMTADDISPSRFDRAKTSVKRLVKNLEGYNISLITFSAVPFVRAPFSSYNQALVDKIDHLDHGEFPPTLDFVGTAIGDAIYMGVENLLNNAQSQENPGIVILLTDGDSNKGSEPRGASKYGANQNIPIYTLAIGKDDYVVGEDRVGGQVTTEINIDLLKDISKLSGGEYYRVLEGEEFDHIFEQIAEYVKSQEKTKVVYEKKKLNQYLYKILALLVGMLLVIRVYDFQNT